VLPLAIDPRTVRVGLVGAGEGLARRRAFLAESGVEAPEPGLSDGVQVLFVAGLGRERSAALATQARARGVLVNVEDVQELCDFHVPAVIRRGDLALTVSTNGRAPGLSRLLREWLARVFGPEWTGRLDEVAHARESWRAEGLTASEVSERTRDLVARQGWLP
jgi:precorrin-2 dehydrogenase / sirohydrochlorin ferrochelatase